MVKQGSAMHNYQRKNNRYHGGTDKASRVVTTRLTDAEWEALNKLSTRNGFTLSTVVRKVVVEILKAEGVL